MKYVARLLATFTLALGLIACDNVIFPTGPVDSDSGGHSDTTNTGSGDTGDSNFVLSISGTVRNQMGFVTPAPEGSHIVITWATGPGTRVVFGQGTFNADRTEWSINLTLPPLPDAALFLPFDDSERLYGIGTPIITDRPYADEQVLTEEPTFVAFLNGVAQVIYNTGNTPMALPREWLNAFPVGYSMATSNNVGWQPLNRNVFAFVLQP